MRQMLLKALASGLIMSLFPFAAISAPAGPSHADSLLRLLAKTHDAVSRERIYVQLADLSGDSLNLAAPYWEAALAEAQKTGDIYGCKEALDFLVRKFAGRDARQAEKYIALADSILPGPRHALFRSSLYAYYIWKLMNDNNAVETVKHELDRLKTKIHNELSPEERIEWEFLTGLSIDFSALATETYDNIDKAIPHVEQALEKLEKYPLEERLHMERICRDELSELYMLSKDKRAEKQIRQCIDLHRAWLAMDDRFERPHRDTTGYMMRAYSKMLYLRELISKEKANEYYGKCMELARARGDLAEIYSTSARYYQYMGEYERAVAYIDSAVTVYKRNGTKADFASIYAVQSWLYENLGDYKNALEALRESNTIRHNDRVEEAQNSLAEMQTLFEVGQLELEKSRLANRMKFIALLAGGVLVLLLVGWSVYQYIMVRRLKQIRRQLTDANQEITRQSRRATESEKMKTAFINSMCHEIRTPLNAINGFSELLLDDTLDAHTRREFREQIWTNTTALTTLLENMLELSSLVSSEAPLPQTDTDIGLLCAERLEYQKRQSNNPQVEYIFKGGGEGPCIIPTNVFYMTRVIDNLLQNAAKFTAAGSVTLSCEKDDSQRRLRIRVADTGIGIDPDKREWVFERFAKVDPFKPGSGIGLYLCRLIVTRLGGEIRVCPDYRAGCCIEIVLPC
ncbi:tetratricopeptide repeat-containing sensor histidine kinase [Alistipes finegoldii]|uniref:tetratricopeptide repeat-containing sensor histidine kinase n=1 Tax=Alistipes finegoldii TaxID=214856 RepID=UPI00242E1314|nr:tetratricopeptide repeat-containing sensor histidine kinase [Alistipes finegoldii]